MSKNNVQKKIAMLEHKKRVRKIMAVKATLTRNKQMLLEHYWIPDRGSLWRIWVQPFANILTAAKLAAMNISNLVQWKFMEATARDREEAQNALYDFKRKFAEIQREWTPILQANEEYSNDALPVSDMLWMASSPGTFFATKALKTAFDAAGKPAIEVITGTPFQQLIDNFSTNLTAAEIGAAGFDTAIAGSSGRTARLLGRLNRVFFGAEEQQQNESVLREAPEDKELPLEKQLENIIDITGARNAIEDAAKEAKQIASTSVNELLEKFKRKHTAMKKLLEVTDLAGFRSAAEEAEQIHPEIKVEAIDQVETQIAQGVATLIKNEEFLKELKKKEAGEDATEEEINAITLNPDKTKTAAELVIFGTGMGELMEELSEVLNAYKQNALTQLESFALRDDVIAAVGNDPDIKNYADLIEKTKREIQDA